MGMLVYPSYYGRFSCIASRCRHSCCIGWEIDIDEDSFHRYQAETGEIGKRLRACIDTDGVPHFRLSEEERCPFLNREGLCDLILSLGEASLCEICREHPRFYTVLSDRTEVGLGLCCEEAARLILTEKEPTVFCVEGKSDGCDEWETELLLRRQEVFEILQNRSRDVSFRMSALLSYADGGMPSAEAAVKLCLSLEILTDEWRSLLSRYCEADTALFSRYMASREYEYEQVAIYLAYRYLADALDREDFRRRCVFIVWAYCLVFSLGALTYEENGEFTLDHQIELCRLFSSEIEYNEDNLYAILDTL